MMPLARLLKHFLESISCATNIVDMPIRCGMAGAMNPKYTRPSPEKDAADRLELHGYPFGFVTSCFPHPKPEPSDFE